MKTRFYTSILLVVGIIFVSCNDRSYFTILGKVTHPGAVNKVYLLSTNSSQVHLIDSTELKGENFEFNSTSAYSALYKLRIGDRLFDLIAKNGELIKFQTNLAAASMTYTITGSADNEKIREFSRIFDAYRKKDDKLYEEYTAKFTALGKESDSLKNLFLSRFRKNNDDYSREILNFVRQNRNTLAGFYAANSLDQVKYEQELVAYAGSLKNRFSDNPDVLRFIKQMETVKPVSIGHQAPEFVIQTLKGEKVKLSDYRGKYVMLDFWASWCPPCRQENPNVVRQYHLFRSQGLNILGISLDTGKNDWKNAVIADKLNWKQGSDLQRFDGPTERLYQIQALPSNIIIDPKGIIIAKNIAGRDLEAFLNRIFNRKASF